MHDACATQQSGALIYRFGEQGLQFALVTSRGRGRWVIPKGHIEHGMTAWESATVEALEEAGIEGEIADYELGRYIYSKRDEAPHRLYEVAVYPMLATGILDDWCEAGERRRDWVSPFEAAQRIEERELRHLLTDFAAVVSAIKFAAE